MTITDLGLPDNRRLAVFPITPALHTGSMVINASGGIAIDKGRHHTTDRKGTRLFFIPQNISHRDRTRLSRVGGIGLLTDHDPHHVAIGGVRGVPIHPREEFPGGMIGQIPMLSQDRQRLIHIPGIEWGLGIGSGDTLKTAEIHVVTGRRATRKF